MFCVFFEVEPLEGQADTYFELAMGMKAEVEKIDGFLSVERFAEIGEPGRFLSFSTWRDEKALIRWRTVGKHQVMQSRGRKDIFADYRIRIGEMTGDTERDSPPDQQRFDATAHGAAKAMLFHEFGTGATPASPDTAISNVDFRSVLAPERSARLSGFARQEQALAAMSGTGGQGRSRAFRIIRDYTMTARDEAPQYFPPVASRSSRP